MKVRVANQVKETADYLVFKLLQRLSTPSIATQ
jgi:hypothetical protein